MSKDESTVPPPAVKTCSRCRESKPLDSFGPDKRARSGRRSECNACRHAEYVANPEPVRAQSKAWREANPERYAALKRASHAARYAANAPRERARSAAYRAANPEKRRATLRKYERAHPERRSATEARRVARIRAATVEVVDKRVLLDRDGGRCRYCAALVTLETMHADHVVPIVRGGAHGYDNVVTACAACNLRKGTLTLEEAGMRLL